MNKLFIFILIILSCYNANSEEIPAITLVKNSSGGLTFRVSLKEEGNIKVDWGNNNIKTYNVNAATRSTEATTINEEVKRNAEIKIYGTGIRLFSCQDQFISSLNVSNARELATLECSKNYLRKIDLSNNKALRSFNCNDNRIKTLDLSNNTRLTYLVCSYNYIKDLAIEKNTSLQYLNAADNYIKSINLEKHKNLKHLSLSGNKLSSIAIAHLTSLRHLDISYNKFSPCGLNEIFATIPVRPVEEKTEKTNLIIVHNSGFVSSKTAIAVEKNWNPDIDGKGTARCRL